MPDHIHLFCAPAESETQPLLQWVKYWKSSAANRTFIDRKSELAHGGLNSLWQRFQKYFLRYTDIGFTIDISRMRFADDFLQSMGARAQRAFSEMRQLEAGAIANVDERRMVGHYWLRNPGLAPSASLRNDIEENECADQKVCR